MTTNNNYEVINEYPMLKSNLNKDKILNLETICGTIKKLLFQNLENGYAVGILETEYTNKEIKISGNLAGFSVGQALNIQGVWEIHKKYGKQFNAKEIEPVLPKTREGILNFLSSGLIKGIGKKNALRLYNYFGENILNILEHHPEKLSEIDGFGEKKIQNIINSYQQHLHLKNIFVYLQGHNISTAYAFKIYKTYREKAFDVLENNPYQLAKDIHGIGFKIADKIALDYGIKKNSPDRIKAATTYVLEDALQEGHTYLPEKELNEKTSDLLDISEELIGAEIKNLNLNKEIENPEYRTQNTEENSKLTETNNKLQITCYESRVYLPYAYHTEKNLAQKITTILKENKLFSLKEINIEKLEKELNINFSAEQKTAISLAAKEPFLILTGGPGTGKTVTTRALLDLFSENNLQLTLCAPTGRAAKRLTEATGKEASTIHKLLEFSPKNMAFNKNEHHKLDTDVVIIDEISMVDIFLFYNLLKALKDNCRIILVGDADQLPAVGPGNVLRELLSCDFIPKVKLKVIFRQSEKSLIIKNAHKINIGEFPILPKIINDELQVTSQDFIFIECENTGKVINSIKELYAKLFAIKKYDLKEDIQVLIPTYKGEAGVDNLNKEIKIILNPTSALRHINTSALFFNIGDKVMQIKNNYDKNVFNGDIGIVSEILEEEEIFIIKYPEQKVEYDFIEQDELVLAYCITIHKSQGSEFKIVIMPILTAHYFMLSRNLFYTAVSRAKEKLILLGTKKAIAIAINTNKLIKRYSFLGKRLKEKF